MDAIQTLLNEASTQGVQVYKICPKRIPGMGIGIVTSQRVEANQLLIQIPSAAKRSVDNTPKSLLDKLPKSASSHCILATSLAVDSTPFLATWKAVMSSRDDMLTSMPIAWSSQLQDHLPEAARKFLTKQQARFKRDWNVTSVAFPSLSHDDFLYAWLLVNSRSFYHATPRTKNRPLEDHMVLQPVADLLNHADSGCLVSFTPAGFSVRADRTYEAGEEVTICYGKHSNDHLLVEYGFIMQDNKWDEYLLDEDIYTAMPAISSPNMTADTIIAQLRDEGFLGRYVLDAETVCHRTQVALRSLFLSRGKWVRFAQGADDGSDSQTKVDRMLVSILEKRIQEIAKVCDVVRAIEVGPRFQVDMLLGRWNQITQLIKSTIQRLTPSSGPTECTNLTN